MEGLDGQQSSIQLSAVSFQVVRWRGWVGGFPGLRDETGGSRTHIDSGICNLSTRATCG